jgi:3-keto-disaccharide hydrolase
MRNKTFLPAMALPLALAALALAQGQKQEPGFKTIFDGKSFNGWKMAEEHQDAWSIKDGAIVAHGERSHLYFVGDGQPFADFELKLDVMTEPGSNGGIYIHTEYQPTNWPKKGYEVQVNQTHTDWRKTGSLYGVKDVKEQFVKDNEWYTYHITVKGKHITIKVNDKVAVDWDEPADHKPGADFTRALDKGTFALQAHDPKSTVYFKNIRVKRLS